MELEENASGRDRIARLLAAAGLTVAAAALLRKGRRMTGALVGVGGLVLGYQAATGSEELAGTLSPDSLAPDALGSDATSESGQLRCAICGEPIVPGQRRGPDENDETVHIDCRESMTEVPE